MVVLDGPQPRGRSVYKVRAPVACSKCGVRHGQMHWHGCPALGPAEPHDVYEKGWDASALMVAAEYKERLGSLMDQIAPPCSLSQLRTLMYEEGLL